MGLGRQDEALDLLTSLAQGPDPRPQALLALARLYMDRQEYAQAVSVFRRLTDGSPRDASLRNSLAMALVMAGQQDEAQPHLEEAVRLAPREGVFQLNLGKYFILRQDYEQGHRVLAGLWPWVPPDLRDDTLGHLNQCLTQLGLPLVSAETPSIERPRPSVSPASPSFMPVSTSSRKLLLCCPPGLDNFVDSLIAGLAPEIIIEKLVSSDMAVLRRRLRAHQNIWIEWGNEQAIHITRELAKDLVGKRVFLRIHHYEVIVGLAEQINYHAVTDLMFVGLDMRDMLLAKCPQIRQLVPRIHVVPNGVDMRRYELGRPSPGFNIAYIGYLNFKKAPMLLMHAFERLYRSQPSCHLHVAGVYQDPFHQLACNSFVGNNGLEHAVTYHGWVKDISAWLANKNFILCTSLSESQGMGLMEAIASGVRPLIYNFPEAPGIYPRQWLWNNLDELVEMLHEPYGPQEGRRFVEENYSLELQVQRLKQMLFEECEVIFEGPRVELTRLPATPEACFSEDLPQRLEANKNFGLQLKQTGWLKEASVFLERAWAQSGYQDQQAAHDLLDCHLRRGHYDGLAQVHRQMGMAAASRGDYAAMLQAFYNVYYSAYVNTASYRWQHFDPAIETVLKLIAPHVEPLPAHEGLAACLDPAKLKVVLVLESFDLSWATVRRFVDIGKRLDKSRFEVIYLTRMELQPGWRPVLEDLRTHGCHLLWDQGHDYYTKIRGYLYILRRIGCDVLMMNTQFLTPWYDLLALAGASRKVVKFLAQGGGLETSPDLVVSTVRGALADELAPGVYLGPAYVSEIARRRGQRPSPAGRLKGVCVGRPVKFINNQRFWTVLSQALRQLPGLEIDIVGSQAREIFGTDHSPMERLSLLGFRQDAQEILAGYDVMIDTWPSGGGCTIREAHAAGLPVISCRTPWHEHYSEGASFYGGLDDFIHPDLSLEGFETSALVSRLGRLAQDLDYYRRVQQECARIPVLTPAQFVERLGETLWRLCGRPAGQGVRP
ncbi:MAG: glycosyltransferase [Desulfarculus sp.]|nr:glycosyltransferase [Desulfarculus sp.]